ncbi:unnamed protein product [Urochloa humidicola]
MEELVEEILLDVPPDLQAHLVCAAMVCKAWCRIISDDRFHRRYYRLYRAKPTLLGLRLWFHPGCKAPVRHHKLFLTTATD